MNICHNGWFNTQTDWPIAEEDKVEWESQTENDGMKKGRVKGAASQMQSEQEINMPH